MQQTTTTKQQQPDATEPLPTLHIPPAQPLARTAPHPRDTHIEFFDVGHIYDVKGNRDFMSCTTFVHSFFDEFDADSIIVKMMARAEKWKVSKYYGMTPEEIKDSWTYKGNHASHHGTLLHGCIEYFYNDCLQDFPYDVPELFHTQFKDFHSTVVLGKGYIPYRTEWTVYDEEHELAGSIDMLFQPDKNDPDTLVIYDWKRSAKLSQKTNRFQSMRVPLEHLPDTSYWHYCMQLNIYRHILETQYGKTIAGMYLVGMHPEMDGFQQEKVPLLQTETEEVFALRKEAVEHQRKTETNENEKEGDATNSI